MAFAIAPEGATLDYLNSYTLHMDRIYAEEPEINTSMMIMGWPTVSNMMSYVSLVHWDERERTSQEVARSMLPKMPSRTWNITWKSWVIARLLRSSSYCRTCTTVHR